MASAPASSGSGGGACGSALGAAQGPCASFDGAISNAKLAEACKQQFNGTGFAAPVLDATCPSSQPYRYVCASDQKGVDFCCQTPGTKGDPSCQVCPEHGCNQNLGNNGAGACFADSTECGADPNPAANGAAVPRCPALVSTNSGIGAVCRTWCQANPEYCAASMRSYCQQPENVSLPACSCVAPWGTKWGDLSFTDLQQIVQANPKVQQQLDDQAGSSHSLAIGCAWPPCMTTDKGVMVPPQRSCPAIGNLCVNVIEDVHISDVIAGTVTVGACTNESGSTNHGRALRQGGVGGGLAQLPFRTEMQLWAQHHLPILLVVLAVFLAVCGAVLYLRFRPPTALEVAEANMTLAKLQKERTAKMNDVTNMMLHSINPQVRAAGEVLLRKRRVHAKQVGDHIQAHIDAARRQLHVLEPYTKRSAKAGLRVAALQAEVHSLTQQRERAVADIVAGLPPAAG